MRFIARSLSVLLLAAAAVPCAALAQSFEANYELTRPVAADTDLLPLAGGLRFGNVRVASAFSPSAAAGGGLSLEAGKSWFGRFTVGRSIETDMIAIGGGYRWRDGESVSLQLSRGAVVGVAGSAVVLRFIQRRPTTASSARPPIAATVGTSHGKLLFGVASTISP